MAGKPREQTLCNLCLLVVALNTVNDVTAASVVVKGAGLEAQLRTLSACSSQVVS